MENLNKETKNQKKVVETKGFNFLKVVSILAIILSISLAVTIASSFYQKNKVTGNITFGTTESIGTFERVSLGFPFSYVEEERKIDEKTARLRYENLVLNIAFYFIVISSASYLIKEAFEFFKKKKD